jgi:hypothetical protein
MSREVPIDITNSPDLLRLAEEVQATNTARVLRRGDEPLAVVRPVGKRRVEADCEGLDRQAFLSSLGSWRDLDTNALKRQIREGRGDHRPLIEL